MKEKQLISLFKYPSTHRSGALGALEVTEMLRRDEGGIIGVFWPHSNYLKNVAKKLCKQPEIGIR